MHKQRLGFWAVVCAVALSAGLASAAGPSAPRGPKAQAKWTFLVYLDGDNDLEGAGIKDFGEMASVGSSTDLNIVVLFDRAPGYDSSNGNWTNTRRGLVARGDTPSATWGQDMGELNMGDPATLTSFIQWGVQTYPADRTALVLWNHGGGWRSPRGGASPVVRDICWDETSQDDCLYTREVRQALTDAGTMIDVLGFDACLMNMLEVGYEVRQLARVMVGSEKTEPGDGWPYDTVLGDLAANPAMTAAELGTAIVDRYYASYGNDETQSALDLTEMSPLAGAVTGLADALVAHWNDDRAAVRAAAANVMGAVSAAVIRERHGSAYAGSHGISICLPSDGAPSGYTSTILFGADTTWPAFLNAFEQSMAGSWVAAARDETIAYDDLPFLDLYDFCHRLDGPEIVTPSPLPDATLGAAYSVTLQGQGGQTPYTWAVSGNYVESNPGASWIGGGTDLFGRDVDDDATQITLPFAFPFYGTNYTSAYVCSNGFINFGSADTSSSSNTTAFSNARRIAPLWDDLIFTTARGQGVFMAQGSGHVVIRWQGELFAGGTPVACEAVLHQDGRIRFDYQIAHSNLMPVIGVSRGDGATYTLSNLSGQPTIAANTSRLFQATGLPAWLTLNAGTGVLSGTPAATGSATFTIALTDSPGRQATRTYDLTVRDPIVVPVPTNVYATDDNPALVRVSWDVVANADGYHLYRNTVNNSASATRLNGSLLTGVTYDDTSALGGVTYYYWVRAQQTGVQSAFSAHDTGVRPLPAAPTGVSATDLVPAYVRVTWQTVSGATGYHVYRGTTSDSGQATRITATPVTGTTYDDTTATGGVTYWYWVAALNAAGQGPLSTADLGSRPLPGTPTNVAASDTDPARVRVTWTAAAGATGYHIYRHPSNNSAAATQLNGTPVTGTTYDDTTATGGITYWYWVRAANAAGLGPFSASDTGLRPLPAAPDGVSATDDLPDRITVTWSAVAGATGYYVYRHSSNNSAGATRLNATPTTNTAYDDIDPVTVGGGTWWYWVRAVNAAGNSPFSAPDTGVRPILPAPTTVLASDDRPDRITITWSTVTGATSYLVYRNTVNDTATAVDLYPGGVTGTTAVDIAAATRGGQDLWYWVRAVGAAGTGAWSTPDTGRRPLPPAPTGVSASDDRPEQIIVTWPAVSGATSYYVYRNTTNDSAGASLLTPYGTTSTACADTSVATAGGVTLWYWVRAVNASGHGPLSATDTGCRPLPAAPADLQASDNLPDRIELTWTAVTQATGYSVFRGLTNDSASAVLVGTTQGATAYTDADPLLGASKSYWYWVRAWNAAGSGAFSAADTGCRPGSILVSKTALHVPEGGSATFQVHLSAAPTVDVVVAVTRLGGDADLAVASGASLLFTPLTWNQPRTVTLSAARDADGACGQATFRAAAVGWQARDVVATETDAYTLSITPTPATICQVKQRVDLVATATGFTKPQYKLWVVGPHDGVRASWLSLGSYGESRGWAWTPAHPGVYEFQVWCRETGSNATHELVKSLTGYRVTAGAVSATLSASPAPFTATGQRVNLTGSASGFVRPQYKLWVIGPHDGVTSTWLSLSGYSETKTWSWTAAAPGMYRCELWVRESGSTAQKEATRTLDYQVVAAAKDLALVATPATSCTVGQTVALNASVVGGARPQFKLWIYGKHDGVKATWLCVGGYGTSTVFAWQPAFAGTYQIHLWERETGSTAQKELTTTTNYQVSDPPSG